MKWGIDAVIIIMAVLIAVILPFVGLGLMTVPACFAIGYNHGSSGPKRLNP